MKKLVLLFPGQGSQYAGMGRELCSRYKTADDTFNEANEVLGFNLKNLCFYGTQQELARTENTQPALLTCGVAAFRAFMDEYDITPSFCAGHSLGEITALTCTGAIDFADGLKVVRQRGLFMKEAAAEGTGTMAAILNVSHEIVEEECRKENMSREQVVISNYNAPAELVISGLQDAVSRVAERLFQKGAAVVPLKVSAPFHSSFMKPAAAKFRAELEKYTWKPFKWPVISNVDARPYADPGEIINRLTEQMLKPVKWISAVQFFIREGIEAAVELGGKDVLTRLLQQTTQTIGAYSFNDYNSVNVNALKYGSKQSKEGGERGNYDKLGLIIKCLTIAVCTKNNNWNNEEYQIGVVEPYNKIKNLVEKLEQEKKEPTPEQVYEALEMLRSVFKTKKVPVEEQTERFNELFEETGTRGLFPAFQVA